MRSLRRSLLALLPVAVLVAGCGVSSGEQTKAIAESAPSTTTTVAKGDRKLTPAEEAQLEIAIKTYTELGLSKKEAECFGRGVLDLMNSGKGTSDTSGMMDVINECDIPLAKLNKLNGAGGSSEDAVRLALSTTLKNSGLTKKQADCVADAFVTEYGVDVEAAQDQSKILALFDGCDVDLSKTDFGN